MACGQSDGAIIQADVFNTMQPEISASAWQLDNAIDEYYNNKILEKATI